MEQDYEAINTLPLDSQLEHSRIMGDYYRNLAKNYYYYSLDTGHQHKLSWPKLPSF